MTRVESPTPPRSPWQRFYAAVLVRRRSAWARRAARLPRPVLSVGNLHWGGGGKTPLVAALCELLRDSGRRVGVLSRGYGRRGRAARVVSLGEGPLVEPELAGDEPYLLAERLSGVAIAVCGDRVAASQELLSRLEIDCFVLDDAFSHVRLARDLDLLAFPHADPFGGGRLPPGGRLREPLAASRLAHGAVLTGLDEPDPQAATELARALSPHGFQGETFACALDGSLEAPRGSQEAPRGSQEAPRGSQEAPRGSHQVPPESKPERFVLVSGTARPESVRQTAEDLGLPVVSHLRFPDHFSYPERSLDAIRREAAKTSAALLTTTKDRVKLEGRLGRPLWEIAVTARPEPRFGPWIVEQLQAIERRRRAGPG